MLLFMLLWLVLIGAHGWLSNNYEHLGPLPGQEHNIMTARCDSVRVPVPPSTLSGWVTFSQHLGKNSCPPVEVTVHINGYLPGHTGLFGIHVFENGNIFNGCMKAGGFYTLLNMNHDVPSSQVRHVGDLGNVLGRRDGTIRPSVRERPASLIGPLNDVKRTSVEHAGTDGFRQGGSVGSPRAGNAGARLACCVIRRTCIAVLNDFG